MRTRIISRLPLFSAVLLSLPLAAAANEQVEANRLATKYFEQHIRPVLAAKCVQCHGPKKQEGNLRLDSLRSLLQGGDSGAAIVRGRPEESLLVEAMRYESFEMPPTGQLPEKVVHHFSTWISSGAPWPENDAPIRAETGQISSLDADWWAFKPLQRPDVPQNDGDYWSRNEIDRFVYRKLAENGMQPAPAADKATLARRLFFDVIGLPPTPQELDRYLNDHSPDAYARLVDRLLDDQRYGEHWARYWLDVVRYSESDGWNQDAYRPHIWRYRDYVVDAFNTDKPYPDFVREQLAGDELQRDDPRDLVASGFLRLGIYEYNQRDARSHWNDILNELTDVTGDVFFGMGMACARCHDHKFDPVLQKDYFRLRAFFEPLVWRDDIEFATRKQRAEYDRQLAVWQESTRELRAEIDQLLKPYNDRKWKSTVAKFPLDIQSCFYKPVAKRLSWEHQMAYLVDRQFLEEGGGPLKSIKAQDKEAYESLQQKLADFDEMKPAPLPQLMAATDFGGRISPTTIPGDPKQEPVDPGFPTVLTQMGLDGVIERPAQGPSSGRRTALAAWIGRPDNPLTTRVIVNRIWQEHFGKGIVKTANDFGHLGTPPTHPELLDWLTVEFVEGGWSFKKLHKQILTSAVWRQSTVHPRAWEYQQRDPGEDLIWRAPIRRLKAEQIRDAMLSVSGELSLQFGGPSVDGDSLRRSMYVKSFRNTPDDFLHAFDSANGLKSVAERDTTTTPNQSLLMINGDFTLARAQKLAERLQTIEQALAEEALDFGFRLAWGRQPAPSELSSGLEFLDTKSGVDIASVDRALLVDFCHVLLNSNEFLYVD